MLKRQGILTILTILLLTSCFKEDDPVVPPDPGDVKTETIELTNTYKYQVFFDLERGEAVSQNIKNDYDLGFECGEDGWHILLNSANFMYAGNSGFDNIDIPFDTTGIEWNFDPSDGNLDSTAIGSWVSFEGVDSTHLYTNDVYVVDRGYTASGNRRGYVKVQFTEVTSESYSLTWAKLDGTGKSSFTVAKRDDLSFVWFSFDEGGTEVEVEPYKGDWDLLFTQYTTLLYTDAGDPYPYLVTGALSNRYNVEVAQDEVMDFVSITLEDVEGLEFTSQLDEVGYDWKDIVGDPTSGNVTYQIIEGINYIIRDTDGFYFKLRFIGFYNNDTGEKGYPTFEYQRL